MTQLRQEGSSSAGAYDISVQETVSMGDALKGNLTMALAHSGAGYIYNLTFTNAYSAAFAGTVAVKWISTRGEAGHTIANNQ
jgi:fructose-1-phosphate kinase PfkB-like protein